MTALQALRRGQLERLCKASMDLSKMLKRCCPHRRWPTCISLATLGEEKSTTTFWPV